MVYDVIVIGGGPAGLMACNVLEKNKINYLLLEKNSTPGKKLLITGGTRCNVTNRLSIDEFIVSLNFKHKKFMYPALTFFSSNDIISYFKNNGLKLILEDDMKYFPETNKSSSVLEVLLSNIDKKKMRTNQAVIEIEKQNDIFRLHTKDFIFETKHVVVATGSKSYPQTGSTGDGAVFAEQLGIEVIPFTPAETHIYASDVIKYYKDLQGVSISNITVKINGTKIKTTGSLIFTHFGLSGPAILHLSEDIYREILKKPTTISFNLVKQSVNELHDVINKASDQNMHILKTLEQLTTKRLSRKVLDILKIENIRIKELSNKDINNIINILTNFTVPIDRVEDREKAFVNAGGVDTKELDPKSMESKKVKNLYFIGETIDLHGPIGGYNITIALSTGRLCATDIIHKLSQ
ncbi:NAD(P)/FAD-dependent oxidoreductase [Peloplasma aerotolerans]|uniref:Aminoacetone oxidase family FAD-binding enzyme n=1 Tax=Peloplasma aerotolerans TaxID=3044389 RepID=A0AAW6U5M6_9MOLU|nr:aminoacetone oxidase family FAD-binding enzyme [Mariniplasma sp. M4Ah]MDI6453212.1 aminoacetone oxidase family FAD-binding enzyme [Mariniplasma sp. M4Ah]